MSEHAKAALNQRGRRGSVIFGKAGCLIRTGLEGECGNAMSNLERTFETLWKQLGGVALDREHRFHEKRRWRFDFAHLPSKTAIELDGGTWSGGRHVRGKGFEQDCIKINTAVSLGWRVFRLTSTMLKKDPVRWISMIKDAINETP